MLEINWIIDFVFFCYRKGLLENEMADDISKNELKKEIQSEEESKIEDIKDSSIQDDQTNVSISVCKYFSM